MRAKRQVRNSRTREEENFHEENSMHDREFDTRDFEENENLYMDYEAKTYFPQDKVPKGYVYCYIRKWVDGKHDSENWSRMVSQGWRPVPASRHPERRIVDPMNPGDKMEEYIISNDTILCEREERHQIAESKYFKEKARRQLNSIRDQLSLQRQNALYVNNTSKTFRSQGTAPPDFM